MKKTKVVLLTFNWANHFSLANGYLKAYAERDKFVRDRAAIEIVDFSAENDDVRQALYYLINSRPDILGLSCYCWNINKIIDLTRLLKALRPEAKIILGGPEVGPVADKYLLENPWVDIVVRGEGEITFSELLKYYLGKGNPLPSIEGITFRKNGQIIDNPDRSPVDDLGEIPSPYLEGILIPRDEVTYLETYRGCPYKCAYCFEGKNFPKLRFFPEDRVRKEIELIMNNPNIRSFHFVDSIFNLPKERFKRIAKFLHQANKYNTGLRTVEIMTEFIDEETVELLKKANVWSVETGPQSVNKDTLKTIKRYYDKRKFRRGVRLLMDNGIEVLTDLIIGLPGDNLFKFARSVKTIMALRPTIIIFSILHVLPGTELYANSTKYRIQFDDNAPHLVLNTPTFPYNEIDKAVVMAVSVEKEYSLRRRS